MSHSSPHPHFWEVPLFTRLVLQGHSHSPVSPSQPTATATDPDHSGPTGSTVDGVCGDWVTVGHSRPRLRRPQPLRGFDGQTCSAVQRRASQQGQFVALLVSDPRDEAKTTGNRQEALQEFWFKTSLWEQAADS